MYSVTNKAVDIGEQFRTVLVRLFGGKLAATDYDFKVLDEQSEDLLFYELGERGLGPCLLGVFPGGRIEEYIESRTLTNADLLNPLIRRDYARKLGRFHSLDMPFVKDRIRVLHQIKKLMLDYEDNDGPETLSKRTLLIKGTESASNYVVNFNWQDAYEFMREYERKVNGRITVTAWDVNRCNCLVREELDTFGERVTLIDMEFAGYNQRGLDLGGHFSHWTMDMKAPDFISGLSYPELSIRRQFVKDYLDQCEHEGFDINRDGQDSIEHVLMEAEFYGMMNSLFVALFFVQPSEAFMTSSLAKPFLVSSLFIPSIQSLMLCSF